MRKVIISLLLAMAAVGVWATDVPKLVILTTSEGEINVPITTIQKITYNKQDGSEMYLYTTDGQQTFAISNISKMTLLNVPADTEIATISEPSEDAQKIILNGQVYIIKDRQLFTIKGTKAQ